MKNELRTWNRREGERSSGGEGLPIRRNANGHRFEGRRTVANSKEGERSPVQRKANGHREGEGSSVRRKANGRQEVEGSPVRRNVKGRRYDLEWVSAIWSVYLQRRAKASPLSLIGDGWLLTEPHRQWLSLIGVGGSSTVKMGALCFFFFLTEMANCVEKPFNLCLWLLVFFGYMCWVLKLGF